MTNLKLTDLYAFIKKASNDTYAGGGLYEKNPERAGYKELIFEEGDYHYRDSYTGYLRSWGSEIVRYRGVPVWNTLYGGGMIEGCEHLARKTFKFLKTALTAEDPKLQLFRGPRQMRVGDWRYYYNQQGDLEQFKGSEKITYQNQPVFTHEIIGGRIKDRQK